MASPLPSPSVAGFGGERSSEKKLSLLQILTMLKIKTTIKPYDPDLLLDHDDYGVYCKNLVLKDRKGVYYLVIIPINMKIDLKQFKNLVGASRNVSFASEKDVQRILGCDQGYVSPFGVMNNQDPSKLRVIIDTPLMHSPFNLFMYFHPFVSHEAASISARNLVKFVKYYNHELELVNLFEICAFDEKYLKSEKLTKSVCTKRENSFADCMDDIIDSLYACNIM